MPPHANDIGMHTLVRSLDGLCNYEHMRGSVFKSMRTLASHSVIIRHLFHLNVNMVLYYIHTPLTHTRDIDANQDTKLIHTGKKVFRKR